MHGDYIVMVGSTAHIPQIRVYYLDRKRAFNCTAAGKIEKPFTKKANQDVLKAFGRNEIEMIKAMLHIDEIKCVSIEPKKLIVHGDPWCKWEDVEPQLAKLIEGVLGENGDFIPTA